MQRAGGHGGPEDKPGGLERRAALPGAPSPENVLTRLLFAEQNLERQVLQTQCRRLEAQHYSLSLTAEQLSHSMAVSRGPRAPGGAWKAAGVGGGLQTPRAVSPCKPVFITRTGVVRGDAARPCCPVHARGAADLGRCRAVKGLGCQGSFELAGVSASRALRGAQAPGRA